MIDSKSIINLKKKVMIIGENQAGSQSQKMEAILPF